MRAELAPATSRAFALTTGTIGLVAIAVLVLAVSPARQQHPIAVSATTAPSGVAPVDEPSSQATVASVRRTGPAGTPTATDGLTTVVALATPLGSGRYALVSLAALGPDSATSLDVVLPSGRTTSGRVVERSSESVLVHLSVAEPGRDIAERRPHDRDMVTVMSQPPIKVTFADVASLEVEEGTPVIDGDGDLVGLCTGSGHGKPTRLIAIDPSMLADALDDEPDEEAPTTLATTTTTTAVATVDTTGVTTTTSAVSTTTSTLADDEQPPPGPTDG